MVLQSGEMVNFIKRQKRVNIFFIFFAISGVIFFSAAQVYNPVKVIVIDPGHGGKDPGCNGIFSKEKDISLAVALKLKNYIEKYIPDVKVYLTRETDEFVELEERAQFANRLKADLFVSIHCNAAGKPVMIRDPKTRKMKVKMRMNSRGKWIPVETINPEPFGTETYVMGIKNEEGKMQVAMRENASIYLEDDYEKKYEGFDPDSEETYIIMSNYTSALVIKSALLAKKIQEDFTTYAGRIDKGVHRQSIWVLWRTSMPSVLTELGYLTNPQEEKFLASETGQDYLAKCLCRALRRYKCESEGKKYDYADELENIQPLVNENLILLQNIKEEYSPKDKTQNSEETPKQDITDNAEKEPTVSKSSNHSPEKTSEPKNIPEPFSSQSCDTLSDTMPVYKVQFLTSQVPVNLIIYENKGLICPHYYRQDNFYKYVSGTFVRMKDAARHQKDLTENGLKDCFVIAFYKGKRISMEEARQFHPYSGNQ